jgi:hypothetical protein
MDTGTPPRIACRAQSVFSKSTPKPGSFMSVTDKALQAGWIAFTMATEINKKKTITL